MLVLANLTITDRLLVLVVVLRFCSTTLVVSTVFTMLDGCLSEYSFVLDGNKKQFR